ncbi:MAG: hypothetical protein IKM17_08865, partial [Lentisphaeria bacterium]|nr:hypothetical protein [Lentisphaeria bacterium]
MSRFDRNTEYWIKNAGGKVVACGTDCVFVVPAQYFSDELESLLKNFDQTLSGGKILKNSPTTTAALVDCAGQNLFLKRTNNKNWKFTLRYLFRSARAFRSAASAAKLAQLGIPTPPVIAAGERRCGLILKCGYLVTGSENGICGMDRAIMASANPLETMADFLEKAADMMALLHRNNVLHGDLKLCNFYRAGNGEPGIWDLDSMKIYRKQVPLRKIETEITRLLASC